MSNDRNVFSLSVFLRYASFKKNMKVLCTLILLLLRNFTRFDFNQTSTMELRLKCNESCNPPANLCRRSVSDISQFQRISFIINRQCHIHIRDWHVDDARHNFPTIFSEQIVSDRAALWCHDSHAISIRLLLDDRHKVLEKEEYTFSRLYTLRVAGGWKKRARWEKYIHVKEREKACRNGPVLMVKRGISA